MVKQPPDLDDQPNLWSEIACFSGFCTGANLEPNSIACGHLLPSGAKDFVLVAHEIKRTRYRFPSPSFVLTRPSLETPTARSR